MADGSLRTTHAVRIDPVCQQFEAAWQRGDRPKTEDFVERADVADRETLRSELRQIEAEYRRLLGEQPTSVPPPYSDLETVDPGAQQNSFRPDKGVDSVPRAGHTCADVPTRLGRYQITGTLGEGAFGVVYRACDPELRRDVAIKVPRRQRGASAGADEAYLAEARTLAKLDHPGIVPVLDVGRTDDGLCYVVSKLMPKGDLAGLLDAGRPPPAVAAGLVAQIAEALHHAHQQGLVHRDVKPANILLDEVGRPLVADFGLALADEAYGSGSTGCGTPAYMSAERRRRRSHSRSC
ncbi:MAG TPA: serine/threonine-protein kinase [Pirellulales bacterium]|nr:serine/threonine-protein kinase [Pirellulales bacterium]